MSGLFVGFIVVAVLAALIITAGVAASRRGRRAVVRADEMPELEDGQYGGSVANVKAKALREEGEKTILGGRVITATGAVLVVIAAVMLAFSFSARVGTNKVGIVTSFGRPVTAESNGWHDKAPWQKMTQFDGAQQPLQFGDGARSENGAKTFGKVKVRLAGNSTADLSGTVTWQMRARTEAEKNQAVELFRAWRTFDRVREFFVWPGIQTALGEVFDDFNPLVEAQNLPLSELNQRAATAIRGKFGGQLEVISVNMRVPDYDQNTDNAISALQQERQRTETAKQKQKTNAAESAAAAALATAQNTAPSQEVLINKCLDIAKEQGKEPGYCFLRGGTPVIGARP